VTRGALRASRGRVTCVDPGRGGGDAVGTPNTNQNTEHWYRWVPGATHLFGFHTDLLIGPRAGAGRRPRTSGWALGSGSGVWVVAGGVGSGWPQLPTAVEPQVVGDRLWREGHHLGESEGSAALLDRESALGC
jgi:hypothetical protein